MQKILIVDDEPFNIEVFKDAFRKMDYEIRAAESGHAALELLKEWAPDLIVLDVMMPEMDGLELCQAIKQEPACSMIPVLMLTARSSNGDIIRGFEAGANDYVPKPFVRQVLQARVRSLLIQLQETLQAPPVKTDYDVVTDHNDWRGLTPCYSMQLL